MVIVISINVHISHIMVLCLKSSKEHLILKKLNLCFTKITLFDIFSDLATRERQFLQSLYKKNCHKVNSWQFHS